jgi:hypothetical protein
MVEYPRGAVANVERQQSHLRFVEAVEPDTVVMRITHARRLMKDDLTFAEYYPDGVDVITTTTVPDNKLNLLGWNREDEDLARYSELDILRAVEPDYHVPTDYTIYEEMSAEEQAEAVQYCVEGTRYMYEETADMDLTLLPLVKGRSRDQRERFYELYDELDVDYVSFYATQYYTGGRGVQQNDLVADVEKVAVEYDPELFVMGALSPRVLREFPKNVVAASGFNQWRTRCEPRDSTPEEMRAAYDGLVDEVEDAIARNPYEGLEAEGDA